MSTADALDPFNGLATTGASTSSGVPDFVKKLYRQVVLTKKCGLGTASTTRANVIL